MRSSFPLVVAACLSMTGARALVAQGAMCLATPFLVTPAAWRAATTPPTDAQRGPLRLVAELALPGPPSTHRVYLPLESVNGRPVLRIFAPTADRR